ncbi:type II secretion system F family protein [Conexibacter sp. SYSU D00693]|uniref:type II secretion system F family protein n=1 Tax=Conexibacter sp. SYSU D00693 TaxID=2812560 RepID=UPI00196A2570|nr:type II secretion system F family protein [Conexibacter sp. SYSU D00693]
MTRSALLAFVAGACAVGGAWELLGALHEASASRVAGRLLAPLRLAGLAGREPTSAERRRLVLLGAGTALAGGWLLAGPVFGLLVAAAAPVAVSRLVAARRARWRRDLAEGAPAAARAMADALAGGHSLRGAVTSAGAHGGVPGAAGRELAAAGAALAVGARTEAVLDRLRDRARDPAWDAVVAAVLLQRATGGDLAALLRAIAARQEEGRRVEADARSLTAQARFTAHLVCGLPVVAAGLAELASPGYLTGLASSPITLALLLCSVALQAAALVAVSRMARVGEA